MSNEKPTTDYVDPEVAQNLLKIRHALVVGDAQEAYRWLYLIADNGRDSLTPWDELERIAALIPVDAIPKDEEN